MNISYTGIPGLCILEPVVYEDSRGYFYESFNEDKLREKGLSYAFVQDNQSKSIYGVIRGLHYQLDPYAQTKIIRVLEGSIYDLVVDIRKGSPTFGKSFGIELTSDNKKQLYIPKGFAHGFSVLSHVAVILYKCDCLYAPGSEGGIRYDDPLLNIDWKINRSTAIVSQKDMNLPLLKDANYNFTFE